LVFFTLAEYEGWRCSNKEYYRHQLASTGINWHQLASTGIPQGEVVKPGYEA